MCGDPKSTLAQNAHVCLDVNVEQEACPFEPGADVEHDGDAVLGDALAMVLLEARGFKQGRFR